MKKTIILFSFALLVAITGCRKEVTPIGLDLRDDLLGTTFTDTTTLVAWSLKEDSIATTKTTYNLLGMLNDPVFGKTTAAIYTQFKLGQTVAFGTNSTLDSIVLCLPYGGYYGDTMQTINIQVFELEESFVDKIYYSNDQLRHKSNNITMASGGLQTRYNPRTKRTIDAQVVDAHLRIRLDNSFGQQFITNKELSPNDFSTLLKGLYIEATAASGSGTMGYFVLNSDVAGITLYYKKDTVSATQKFATAGAEIIRFTQFQHDFSQSTNSQFLQMIQSGNHSVGEQLLFAQPNGGIKTKIEFPHLVNQFKGQNVMINRAELVISKEMPNEPYFSPAPSLSLQGIRSDKGVFMLPDDAYLTGTSFFGGIYDSTKHEYRFRITRHIQNIIQERTENYGIYLVTNGSAIRSARTVFYGTRPFDNSKRLRLEISYTIY